MPIATQQGDIAARLRNFFKATGRIGTTLDEVVVPVAVVQQLDQPPFRGSAYDFAMFRQRTAIVGATSFAGLFVPAGVQGVAVAEQVTVVNETAAALFYRLVQFEDPATVLANYSQLPCYNVERPDRSNAGVPATVPVASFIGSWVAPAYQLLAAFSVGAGDQQTVSTRISMRAGVQDNPAISRAIAVICTTQNTVVTASWRGQWYPEQL